MTESDAEVGLRVLADPFAENELESGRLPKIIDDWLTAQIQAGLDTDSIRRLLQMTDDEKEEVSRILPSSVSR